MFAVILIGHGEFSTGLKNAAEMILGEQEKLVAVPLLPIDSPEVYLEKLREAVKPYEEFVILADLKGGTPANLASFLVKNKNCKCITGANLPMLLEILGSRLSGMTIENSISGAIKIGNTGIFEINSDNM
ncbi:PTS sugar transporter subunit IIA [Maledivibacter halophilus]|uniref:PTS system, mannose-specific IIA component n=1 Tax=Maledivibacter halophilus TaxID=36842 RepID=A0A1T5L1S7_9FIRM|nr:PTS sugar transporter subunit IIA [Maledivibacter halophilus]SKC69883.1 PTS system, mannose-specific IIA component [Maledivibacter halophilus]